MDDKYDDNRSGGSRQSGRYRDSRYDSNPRGGDDRGFFERAGEEVRSWFGSDEGRRDYDSERSMTDYRDNQAHHDRHPGGGWGNQEGESWNRDRPGASGSYGAFGGSDYRQSRDRDSEPSRYRRDEPFGGFGSSGGSAPHSSASRYGGSMGGMAAGGMGQSMGGARGRDLHDPHYSEWRSRQIESLDRDYDEYRREHQSKFEQDFGNWRMKRGEQRQSIRKVAEHMEVMSSDGQKIGTVDAVHGDRIVLTKNDENAAGHHHSIPCSWIETVDDKVTVNKSRDEAMNAWRDEERSRALFEREDQGSTGPHVLNRSFSGTY